MNHIESIPDDIDPEFDPMDLSPEFQAELDRHLQNAKENPEAGRPWREVIAELMKTPSKKFRG